MTFIRWLKWWFWETRRCSHERDSGKLIDMGMSKAWHCRKCGKCLEML